MNINEINDEYFAWLSDKVCKGRFSKDVSYSELLHALHKTEFRWKMRNDANLMVLCFVVDSHHSWDLKRIISYHI